MCFFHFFSSNIVSIDEVEFFLFFGPILTKNDKKLGHFGPKMAQNEDLSVFSFPNYILLFIILCIKIIINSFEQKSQWLPWNIHFDPVFRGTRNNLWKIKLKFTVLEGSKQCKIIFLLFLSHFFPLVN